MQNVQIIENPYQAGHQPSLYLTVQLACYTTEFSCLGDQAECHSFENQDGNNDQIFKVLRHSSS